METPDGVPKLSQGRTAGRPCGPAALGTFVLRHDDSFEAPMLVSRVRWAPYRVPFKAPYATSAGVSMQREGLVVCVEDEDGRAGWGEAALRPGPEPRIETMSALLRGFARALKGKPVDRPPRFGGFDDDEQSGGIFAAVACALDTALLDLEAHTANKPVAWLLSEASAASVAVNALVAASDTASAVQQARAAAEAGFGTIKLKLAAYYGIDADRERVAAVREAVGPHVKLRLDPNGAWRADEAIQAIRALEPYGIEYVEQPVAPGDVDAMAHVQAGVAVDVAADEDVTDAASADAVIRAGAARVLILKPQQLGGLRPALALAQHAHEAGLRCVVTTNIETGIGTAACLQLAAALPGEPAAHGLATAGLLLDGLATPLIEVERGEMQVPPSPGLGVRLDEERARQFLGPWLEVS